MKTNILRTYYNLPEFVKDFLGFFFRKFKKFRQEATSDEDLYIKELNESEYLSYDQLEQLQFKKLTKLILYASEHVPHYRDLFDKLELKPEDIKSLNDLQKLPILTKDMIRNNPDYFISDLVKDKSKLTKIATGGSTGTPMTYYFDEHMVGVRRATWWRWTKFAGVDLYKDKMIYCGGAPGKWIFPPENYRGLANFTRDCLVLSAAAMSDKVIDRYIRDIKKFKGDYIRGYASGVYLLGCKIIERGEVLPMKAVLTSSDTLYPNYRAVIEKAFRCKVYDHYGQNEDILTATECEYTNGFHINMETCIAETVNDNNDVVYGEEGHFVSTHLENFIMPLIRYDVGDIGVIDINPVKCECGRYHQKIIRFSGRYGEFIMTPDGRKFGGAGLSLTMKTIIKSMKQCQYIQNSLYHLTIKIVPTKFWNPDADPAKFTQGLRKQLGDQIKIDFELVDSIETRDNGKFPFIVSCLGEDTRNGKYF